MTFVQQASEHSSRLRFNFVSVTKDDIFKETSEQFSALFLHNKY